MKAEVKEKWVTELRSGKYQQTTGALQKDGRFCCLGVLCEVAVAEGVIEAPRPDWGGKVVYDGADSVLPASVRDWAELNGYCGDIPDPSEFPRPACDYPDEENPDHHHGYFLALAELNDEAGFDFLRIADVIESKF